MQMRRGAPLLYELAVERLPLVRLCCASGSSGQECPLHTSLAATESRWLDRSMKKCPLTPEWAFPKIAGELQRVELTAKIAPTVWLLCTATIHGGLVRFAPPCDPGKIRKDGEIGLEPCTNR